MLHVVISNLQGYYESVTVGLDDPHSFLVGESDSLGSLLNLLRLVDPINLSVGSLLGNSYVLLLRPIRGS